MKKNIILFSILVTALLSACSNPVDQIAAITSAVPSQSFSVTEYMQSTAIASNAIPQRTPLKRQPCSDGELSIDFPDRFITSRLAKAESNQIGLYEEQELLFDSYFSLGDDVGYGSKFSSGTLNRSLERHVREFPEPGVRNMGDYIYLMYDTDKGSRLYLYYPKLEGQPHFRNGYAVLMKKMLSYRSFQGLSVGDSIQQVSQIDSVIPVYIKDFDAATDAALENYQKEGIYLTSVHLLSDGILKIEYERTKEKDYVIHSLVFRDDFTLDGFDGKTCYRILKEDYVSADSK